MGFRQIDLFRESDRINKPIAGLAMLPPEFTAKFAVQFFDHDENDGLGVMKAALVQTDSGRKFGLVHYIHHPEPKGISIWTHEDTKDPVADLHDFMKEFGLKKA